MTEQAVDMEIPTEICTYEIKNDNLQHYFFCFRFCFSDASPMLGLFIMVVFLCKRTVLW